MDAMHNHGRCRFENEFKFTCPVCYVTVIGLIPCEDGVYEYEKNDGHWRHLFYSINADTE